MDIESFINSSSNEPSNDHSYAAASLDSINILGLNCSENQLEPVAQDIQILTLDWQMLQAHPLLFRETARLLQTRAHSHQKLNKLAAEFCQLSQNINHQSPSQQIRADKFTQLHQSSQQLKKLQLKFDQINNQNDQQAEKTQSLRKINRQLLTQLKQLQEFIHQMATDRQNNPFATVQDSTYKNSLRLVSEIDQQLGRPHAQIQVPSQDILETIKVKNSAMIEERTQWIKILEQLDTEVNKLITLEKLLFQGVKDNIVKAKRQRNNDEEMDDENSEIEFEIDLVPSLLQNAIEATDTTVKDCERINVTLQEYQQRIRQLSKTHTFLETDLKSAQSILSQKTSKYAYLQKQNKQLSVEQKKLQSLNDRSLEDIRDSVNYEGLVFKTYEQKETPKSQKQKDQMAIDISSEMAKPARRIVVGKKTLEIQKLFPFINNYRQLVNWAIVLWVLIVLAVFLGKTVGNSEVLPSSPQIIEFELHSQPTFQTIQTQPKIDLAVENQTSTIIETPTVQEINTVDSDKEQKVLTEKRTHMEQVNTHAANDENQDWQNIAFKGFQ